MVARLLRLRLRVLVNATKRGRAAVAGAVLGVLYLAALVWVAIVALGTLRAEEDVAALGDALVVGGAVVLAASVLAPLAFAGDDPLDARAFSLFGFRATPLSGALLLVGSISVPVLAMIVVSGAAVVAWGAAGAGTVLVAILAAVLFILQCALLIRICVAVAADVIGSRRSRELGGVLGVVLVAVVAPLGIAVTGMEWEGDGRSTLASVSAVLGWTPFGAAWGLPAAAAVGDAGAVVVRLLIALATCAALALLWRALVAVLLGPERRRRVRSARASGLGWFDRLRDTPGGVIAARSASYWGRDPRYQLPLLAIPILPVIMVGLFGAVEVPWNLLALLPLPFVLLFLGWSLHNDLAYDGSAVWLHVAAGVRGTADRLGRMFPTLLIGIPVLLIGSVVSVVGYGDWAVLPSVLGVNTVILLGAVGISSYISVRFPYPAPRPGDSAWLQPQTPGRSGGTVQCLSFVALAIVCAPTIALTTLAVLEQNEGLHVAALGAGIVSGGLALWGGVVAGGHVFDRGGPEIVALASRG